MEAAGCCGLLERWDWPLAEAVLGNPDVLSGWQCISCVSTVGVLQKPRPVECCCSGVINEQALLLGLQWSKVAFLNVCVNLSCY